MGEETRSVVPVSVVATLAGDENELFIKRFRFRATRERVPSERHQIPDPKRSAFVVGCHLAPGVCGFSESYSQVNMISESPRNQVPGPPNSPRAPARAPALVSESLNCFWLLDSK